MSTLRTNALEGMDAKNSITIVAGAGNVTTTSVQEGLAKQTIQYSGSANTIDGSTNTSSVTDNGTGNFTVNYTNNFASVGTQSSTASVFATSSQDRTIQYGAMTTSTILMIIMIGGSLNDILGTGVVHGDLA